MQLRANHRCRVCQKIIHVLCVSQDLAQHSDKQISSLCQTEDNVLKIIMPSKQDINTLDKTGRQNTTGVDEDEEHKARAKRTG